MHGYRPSAQDGTREAAGGEHKSFANFLQQPIRGISGIDNVKKSILQHSHPQSIVAILVQDSLIKPEQLLQTISSSAASTN